MCLKTDERENEWRKDGGKGKQEKEKERNKKVKKFENHVRIFLSGIEAGYLLECSRLCSSIRLPRVLSLPSREFDFLSIIIIFFPLTLCRDVVPASCIFYLTNLLFLIQYEGHFLTNIGLMFDTVWHSLYNHHTHTFLKVRPVFSG